MSRYKFRRIYVEITNVCNLSCSFCAKNVRPPDFLTLDNFSIILDRIRNFTKDIYLHVLGEPLMHQNFSQILELCQSYVFLVHITTNGTLLADRLNTLLKHNIKWINISLHSTPYSDKSKHIEWINSTLASAERLVESGCCVALRMWQYDNMWQLSELDAITMDIVGRHFELSPLGLYSTGAVRIGNRLFLSLEKQFEWPKLSPKGNTRGRCLGGVDMLAVLVDGTVTPCCMDSRGEINFGNIFAQPLDEILSSERYTSFYTGMKKCTLTESLCQSCTYRHRFDHRAI